jgi:hypothetical protein
LSGFSSTPLIHIPSTISTASGFGSIIAKKPF